MNLTMKVSIVIPVYGREDVFSTIRILQGGNVVKDCRIVIVDNGNDKELSERIKGLSGERIDIIRLSENEGGSGGYIAGVKYVLANHSGVEFVWLLDDDALPNDYTLYGLMRAYQRISLYDESVACVGSAIVNKDSPSCIIECGADFSVWTWKIRLNKRGDLISEEVNDYKVGYCSGCSVLIPVAVIRKCGFWDDVFIHYDDVEWGMRVSQLYGMNCYSTTSSVVAHPFGSRGKNGFWIEYYNVRNLLWITSRYSKVALLYWINRLFFGFLKAIVVNGVDDGLRCRVLGWVDFLMRRRKKRAQIVSWLKQRRECEE